MVMGGLSKAATEQVQGDQKGLVVNTVLMAHSVWDLASQACGIDQCC